MKPERWQQLDKLFHAAVERAPEERAAFLDEACAGDESLRKQVEALLAAHVEAGSFMENPAMEVEARGVAADSGGTEAELATGETVSRYRIISLLGVGGMGQVYLAQDMTLGRKVALKLLPVDFTRDKERVRRFQQEARAASSLNHPNIITIHEIGQAEDRHFLATEYIDGLTLRQYLREPQSRLAAGGKLTGLQLSEALSITMQVADALAAAHAKGIVHRDIKPENIMLVKDRHLMRKESFVKVLDFGIAKLTEPQTTEGGAEATTRVLLNTHEGSVIGTASYMSPEQARGENVDARTDVWSLGIVLYEMLTNGVPFGGNTTQDVIASILKEEPAPLSLEVPDRLRWIVEKALRKEREERYQTAREMFSDLRNLHKQRGHTIEERATLTGGVPARTHLNAEYFFGEVKRHRWAAVIVLTALVIGVAGTAFGLYKYINQKQPKSAVAPFQTMKIARLTSTGKAADAAISPDGRWVVHVKEDGGQQSLWLRQVSTPSDVQIIPPADVTYYPGLTFSLDGNSIYYGVFNKKEGFNSLYQITLLGGSPTKLITDIDSVVTFSPDGKQLAFLRGYATGETALLVANADGSAERKLASRTVPDFFGANGIETAAWSPDGRVIACPAGSTDAKGRYMTLVERRVADGSERLISSQRWWQVGRMAWLRDGSGLVFTARDRAASPSQIWYLSYPGGEARRITNDLHDYAALSLTADSAALVTVESEQVSNIWIAPNNDARRASQITETKFDGVEGISWTPDGRIVYASRASGNLDLWITETDGGRQKQLTSNNGNNGWPSVSSDGRYVVFTSDRTGINHIWRMDIDGNNPKQLTNGNDESTPQCSPNSQWFVYVGVEGGQYKLLKMPLDGSGPVQTIQNIYMGAAISADGKWIAFGSSEPPFGIAIYPFEGGKPHRMLDFLNHLIRPTLNWSPDGQALAFIEPNSLSNISSQPLDGGARRRLTDFTSERIFSFAWSRDGKQLALARGTVTNDVVLISNFTDQR